MALQPVFKRSYIEYLKTHIRPSDYLSDHFEYDRTQVVRLYGIRHPEDLLQRLNPTPEGDLQSAIAIYEAYKDITPLFAQQDDLWVYLTHVDLFDYVKKRWPEVKNGGRTGSPQEYIRDHWFRNRFNFLRTSIAGLWWDIYLTYDKDRNDPYELSEFLFKNQEFRTSSFGELPLIRHKEAMMGILDFLKDHSYLFQDGFNAKARYLRHLFNIIGGYKNLSYLSRYFYKDTLNQHLSYLEKLHDAKDAKADSDIYKEIVL